MYCVLVKFNVTPQTRQPLVDLLSKDGEDSIRDEPGTLRFDLIEDETNPDCIYVLEGYADKAALDTHMQREPYILAHAGIAELRVKSGVTSEILGRGTSIFPK